MISTNQFKNGNHIEVEGTVFKILEFQHVKPGKGGAFVRTKLRRASDGAVIDRTFRAGEKFRPIRTEARKMQFLYADGTDAHFMDEESYDQIALPETGVEEALKWIKPTRASTCSTSTASRRTSSSPLGRARGHAHRARHARGHRLRRRQQARHAGDGRDRERAAVREHRGPGEGRHALGLLHVPRLRAAAQAPPGRRADPSGVRTRAGPLLLLVAFAAAAALVWHAAGEAYWSDFGVEAYPAYKALQAGDLHTFSELLPAYGGYLTVVGAPLALLAGWLGGIEELTLGLTAIPAGIAVALLTAGFAGGSRPGRAAARPLPRAGRPAAAGQAHARLRPSGGRARRRRLGRRRARRARGRTTAAAALLALAIVSKQWAVLAVLPAMLAAPRRPLRLGPTALAAPAPCWSR